MLRSDVSLCFVFHHYLYFNIWWEYMICRSVNVPGYYKHYPKLLHIYHLRKLVKNEIKTEWKQNSWKKTKIHIRVATQLQHHIHIQKTSKRLSLFIIYWGIWNKCHKNIKWRFTNFEKCYCWAWCAQNPNMLHMQPERMQGWDGKFT